MTTQFKTILVGIATLALCAITYWYIPDDSVQRTSVASNTELKSNNSQTELNQKLDAVLASLTKSESQISTLESKLNRLNERLSAVEKESADSEDSTVAYNTTAQKPERSYTFEEYSERLERQFSNEEIDAQWSANHEANFSDLLQNQTKPTYQNIEFSNIECKSRTCRVDIVSNQSSDIEEFEFDFFVDASRQGLPRVRSSIDRVTGTRSYFFTEEQKVSRTIDDSFLQGLINPG